MTPDEFRKYGHQLIDWIADYRATIAERPVMSQVRPGDILARLPEAPPGEPEPFDAVIKDLNDIILPGVTHWQHPAFFGYFPSNAPFASVLGDLVSSGLGTLGLSWQAAPALTELEDRMCDWVRLMVGLEEGWQGVIQDTASTCTLLALLCARERTTKFSFDRGGMQAEPKPLTVYVSEQSHSSVEKAALLAGFGRANVRKMPCDDKYAMNADALHEMMIVDAKAGLVPCAVVATTGTTASTALDPINDVSSAAATYSAWVHVDAAHAGSAMILPECRWMWAGIERADSLVMNPHKWLGAQFDCSLFYVKDSRHLLKVMSTNPSYLQGNADEKVKNYRDWGIALGRRFRSLKLWTLIRSEGVSGLQARLRRDIANAKWLAEQVSATPQWSVVAPVSLQTVCVRHEPPGVEGIELDEHTRKWADRVNRSGRAYVTPAQLGDRWMVRASVGAERTERKDVEVVWSIMQEAAANISQLMLQITARQVLERYQRLPAFSDSPLVDVNQKGLFSEYPIHVACIQGNLEDVRALIAAGADLNVLGDMNCRPIHDAIGQGHSDVAILLVESGADLTVVNDFGNTPLSKAKDKGLTDVVSAIESALRQRQKAKQ